MPFVPSSYAESPAGYVRALLDLLGDRDPVAVQRATPGRLREAVAGLGAEAARAPEAPGKWSVVEVVQHLADSEVVYGYRMRLIVAEDAPPIPGYDQDAWAQGLGYREVALADALDDFAALRAINLRWLGRLSGDALRRVGHHSERGEESVGRIVKLLAAHDLAHLRQIARIRAAVGA